MLQVARVKELARLDRQGRLSPLIFFQRPPLFLVFR
jgi:hypothetical protein